MWSSKDVYYVSDSTGILASELGQALLCQFPEISFYEERFPFIRTMKEAEKTIAYILKQSGGRTPFIFSTIVNREVRKVFDRPEVELFDVFASFLERLEESLETKALRAPGFSHHMDAMHMGRRVEAIQYCLNHDDGTRLQEFDAADVILLGVSRSGKTPVSVYLATQMGLKAANFPLTPEFLNNYQLPENIINNLERAVGLTTSPEMLRNVREKRYPGSNYAKIATCAEEVQQAEQLYRQYKIATIATAGKSIEEIATQVSQELGLSKKTASLKNDKPEMAIRENVE